MHDLARRSFRTVLAPLGSIGNVYLILQRSKVWLAAVSALAVQVVAALLFNGPAEPLPPQARPAWSARQLPAAAGGSARKSAGLAPVEIVVPQPDDFEASPSRALQAEQDPAGPKYEMPPADGKTAPPQAELARQSSASDDAALRLAVRPHVWPLFKSSGAMAIEPGVATLEGIEPLDSAAIDTALNGGQP